MKRKGIGQFMLIMAALIWGSSFVVMKDAVSNLPTPMLLCIRFTLGTLFMILLFFKQIKTICLKDLKGGLLAGIALYLAYTVQTIGLTMTTPGKNAFLTAVYCAIVPFLVWLLERKKPDRFQMMAALMCFVGVGMVSLDSSLTMNKGDFLTLVGGFFYALHMIVVKRFMKETSPVKLTTMQFFMVALLSFVQAVFVGDLYSLKLIHSDMILQLFYLAFFATTLALLFQNMGQNLVSECQASILLSLESVFGVFFSVLCGQEYLNGQIVFGFIIIFFAIIISETKLSFLRGKG